MRRLLCALLVGVFTSSLCLTPILVAQGIAIVSPIQTGFVVVTPLQGNGQGLNVSETFGQRVDGSLFQASVLSSPTVTLTDVFVHVDPTTSTNTGIAIVNPNSSTATVTLSLTNQQGSTVAIRTVTIAALQQVSRFATEIFAGVSELTSPFSGLVFINSDIPVGVMGLTFIGPSFTSLPVAAQLSSSSTVNVSTVTTTGIVATTTSVNGTTTTMPIPTAQPTATGLVPTTITQIPSTILGLPTTFAIAPPVPTTTTTTTSAIPGTVTATTAPVAVVSTNGATVNGATAVSTPASASIVTNGAQLLPQFATGGGWSSQVVIANTSAVAQAVRVDIFNSDGSRLVLPFSSSLSSVVVAAGGVVTFSTN